MAGYPMTGRQNPSGQLGGGGPELPPEVVQMIEQAMAGGGSPPMGPTNGAMSGQRMPAPRMPQPPPMGSEMGMGGGGTRAPVAPGANLPTIEPGGGIPEWLTEFLNNKSLGPAGLAGLGGDNGPPPAPLNDKTGVAPATGMNELALQAMGLIAQAARGSGLTGGGGNMAADAVAAVAPPGADGVPADGDIVNPARAGAGGQFGRQPRTGGEYRTRKIRPGETLSGIAGGGGPKRLGGLRGANPSISDPNKIRAGDSINVPVTGVTRAKSGGGGSKKKAIGSKQDIQRRAVSQAKEQSGHDRARKKNKAQAKRQAGNMYGVKGR